MRLIDTDKLLKEMEAGCMPIYEKGISGVLGDESCIKDYIDNAPTIDAKPVRHGKWITKDLKTFLPKTIYKCSECGWGWGGNCEYIPEFKYCPNCAAKMEED